MYDALQSLRDGLRQAAVHSPSLTMRTLAEAALNNPSPRHLAAVGKVAACPYVGRLLSLIADYNLEDPR